MMDEYSQFTMPGCSGIQHSSNLQIGFNLCVCCLLKDVPFVKLSKCKHVEFFECYFKFKLEYPETLVCYGCHKVLKEIYEFKEQVKSSLMRLNDQIQILQLNNTKLSKLTQSDTETYFIDNTEPIEIEIKTPEMLTAEVEIEDVCTSKTDVPQSSVVHNEDSALCQEAPLQKYEGKVRNVILSEAEMEEDRKKEAVKESYLKLPFKCESCITAFDHEVTLTDHLEKRHNEEYGRHTCEICKSVHNTVESLRLHMDRHYKRYECVECGARYRSIRSVLNHCSRLHGALPLQLQCRECDYTAQSHRDYDYHADKHKQKPLCDDCGATFVNKASLKRHMYTVHKMSDRVYSCTQCDKVYRARSGLLTHVASVHTGEGAYCAACNTHFRTEQNLKQHLNTHSSHVSDDHKKFACSECSQRFLSKSLLREHVDWQHLKTTNHKCTHCSKVFKNSRSLKNHTRFTHEKKRPPRNKICDHCGRGFTTTTILRNHIRTHTGERPLCCKHCAATFATNGALYTHNKLLHALKEQG